MVRPHETDCRPESPALTSSPRPPAPFVCCGLPGAGGGPTSASGVGAALSSDPAEQSGLQPGLETGFGTQTLHQVAYPTLEGTWADVQLLGRCAVRDAGGEECQQP